MTLSNRIYDFLKEFCTTYCPAAIACFITVAGAFGMDGKMIETITAVAAAVNTFLGVCLRVSTANYWNGKEIVTSTNEAAHEPANYWE